MDLAIQQSAVQTKRRGTKARVLNHQGWLLCLQKCRRSVLTRSLNSCGLTDGVCVQLPPSFRPREHAQDQLLSALLAREGARSTAVTAPKSRISSQGMGGVGKTMLTAAGTAYTCRNDWLICNAHTSLFVFCLFKLCGTSGFGRASR